MSAPVIAPVTLASAAPKAAATLNAVKAKIGMIPNLYATLAQSPAALDALLAINTAVSEGTLSGAEREIISLATAQVNGCQYCLSAHTLMGKGAGLSAEQILKARSGSGNSARQAAIASFAQSLLTHRGHVAEAEVASARDAGLSDGELMEIVVGVAANTLTNFANNLAKTTLDFPAVALQLPA
ncbi:MAG TPA: peroxidase-related enzyme [Burkholderiaceae bacterium]|jgi:uncharacterized peroxidase-related enzyme